MGSSSLSSSSPPVGGVAGAISSSESELSELELELELELLDDLLSLSLSELSESEESELSESGTLLFFFFLAAATAASSSAFFLDCFDDLPAFATCFVVSNSLRLRLPGSCMVSSSTFLLLFFTTFCMMSVRLGWRRLADSVSGAGGLSASRECFCSRF